MGGIGFVLVMIALPLIFISFEFDHSYLALAALVAAFSLIGLLDDLLKIFKQQNLGLTFWQKILLQTFTGGMFAFYLIKLGYHLTVGPALSWLGLADPVLFWAFAVFLIVGGANATNLSDGLNGLLAGSGTIALLAFAVLANRLGMADAVTFCLVAAGALVVFLFFNFPKAKVFMGDVGSLSVGAALAGIALIMHQELALAVIGGLFVLEALSVIIQVTSYKLFKKRVFRMAPLHHHFEMLGFTELQVVLGAWLVALALGLIGNML